MFYTPNMRNTICVPYTVSPAFRSLKLRGARGLAVLLLQPAVRLCTSNAGDGTLADGLVDAAEYPSELLQQLRRRFE